MMKFIFLMSYYQLNITNITDLDNADIVNKDDGNDIML